MRKLIAKFLADQSGATAIEYGLIAAGISIVIVTVVNGLATAARATVGKLLAFREFRDITATRPALMVLGTGWGLTEEVLAGCDARLPPVRGVGDYNHLSVRSACAILLDRVYGDRED